LANETFFEDAEQWGAAKYLGECLNSSGLEIQQLASGAVFGGHGEQVQIKSIWPGGQASGTSQLSENDKSLVLLIEFAGRRILLCSDIEKAGQKEILICGPIL